MILYGNSKNSFEVATASNSVILNFTSLNEKYKRLALMPPNNLGAVDEYDFDVRYAHWIIDNDNNFIEFMNLICMSEEGKLVYLEIDEDYDWSQLLIESLIKLIQERYGIVALKLSSFSDLLYCNETGISEQCQQMFDTDFQRYEYISEKSRIESGGSINVSDS